MRIVQAVVAVAPPLLILWMGGTYLVDAGRLLLAPGVPVALELKTPGGKVRLRAEGYRLDIGHRAAAVWGISARRANGASIATVASVEAGGLDPLALRPVVRVRGVRAHLERDQNGFDLARLFPKKEGPPSTIPFSVTLQDAQVVYVDRTFQKPVRQVAQVDLATFDGVGDDWLGRSQRVRLPGIGTVAAQAQSLANVGVTLDLRADRLRLERIAPVLVPGLRVTSLVAYGPMRIDVPKAGQVRAAATLRAEGTGLRYGRYALDAVSFDGKAGALGLKGEGGLEGAVLARLGRVRARFQGSATLKTGGGQVVVNTPSPRDLAPWVRAYLPPKVGFRDAAYTGWVAWAGKTVHADGDATAARADYGPDSVDGVRARVAYAPGRVEVRDLTLKWKGAPLAGDASYEIATRAVHAAVVAPRLQLATIARRLGNASGVSGIVGGEALVSGTAAKPEIEGRVGGRVALRGRDLGEVEARGAWLAGAARVDRLRVGGPLGAIVAGGTVRPDGTLDFKAEARGLRVERIVPDARGLVSANLRLGGTLRDPKATGRLEAYRLAYAGQTLPAAGFDLSADRSRIDLTLFTAVRGTARVAGRVGASLVGPGVRLADPLTWLLDGEGSLTGIQVAELPGAEGMDDLAGILSIPRATLSGRVGNPVVAARLAGAGIIVRGERIDSLRADARVTKAGAAVSNVDVRAADGRVTGSGRYAFATKSGSVDLAASDFQLNRLLVDLSEDVVVEGTLSAPKVHLALRDGKPFGTAEGTLTAVKVNGVLAGDGNWSLDATGERIKADASVGRLDPELRALDASGVYNVKAGSLAATVTAKDVPLQAVVAIVQSKRSVSEDEATRLQSISGDLSGTATAVRTREGEVKIDASDLRAATIRYGVPAQLDYGTLTATTLIRRGNRWDLTGGLLEGPEGRFTADGWVEEDGPLSLTASGERIKLSAFSPFAPQLAELTGVARFALTATGTVQSPTVVGTAGVDSLLAGDPKTSTSLALEEISVSDGRSSVRGVLRYGERFGGLFTLSTGWRFRQPVKEAPFEAKADFGLLSPVDAADPTKGLKVDTVALADVPGLSAYIDPKRTVGGTLSGGFAASGTYLDPRVTGGIAFRADRLGITVPGTAGRPLTRIDDTLQSVKADLGFDDRGAPKLTASVGFPRGGKIDALLTLGNLDGQSFAQVLEKRRDWKALPISGYLDFPEDAKPTFRQTVAGATTAASIEGRITTGGTAVRPVVSGSLLVSNFETTLPTLGEGGTATAPPVVDPQFEDVRIALGKGVGKNVVPDPGRFRTATADLYLTGDVKINGSLSNPKASADFLTDHGSIRLPGGVVRVVKDGQIDFDYREALAGGTPASANIDLQGRSQLTLVRPGSTISQRYDITLDMQGDLLREGGLRFDATSDPPELNKDEILNALGGTDLISGVTAGGRSTETGVRNAFAGFALPGLLDPVTGGLAHLTGLDYVSLEYNAYDQTTLNFGRALPFGFSFQGRQQVGTPTPGYRSIYDLRLSYSPRKFLPKLSRLSFTVGTDQDRPWKASAEFGTRFGPRGGTPKEKHVIFSASNPKDRRKGNAVGKGLPNDGNPPRP